MTRAVTEGGAAGLQGGQGACWPFYAAKLRFMIFGIYPYDEHWRVLLAMGLFIGAIGIIHDPSLLEPGLLVLWAVTRSLPTAI